jgi:D-glycero-alpha-D-manno-heptose-7-phosphate kinase
MTASQFSIRSKAPLRISFAGGGTDVSPYVDERGGAVLNATINKYAYVTLRPRQDDVIQLYSTAYNITAKYQVEGPLPYDGTLDLLKAAINRACPRILDNTAACPAIDPRIVPTSPERQAAATQNDPPTSRGLEFFVHNDAPPGSGLGGSSTLVVAMLAALREWLHAPWTDYEVAQLAFQIERVDMAMAGGRQDQYAAAFGGFNFIEFQPSAESADATVLVNPLRVRRSTLNELQHNLLLCYTGRTRMSDAIIKSQAQNYRRQAQEAIRAMDELKRLAYEMKKQLLTGNLTAFGHLLHQAWINKRKMSTRISTTRIDELYDTARRAGALGGKISGAGGGGYMFFYCPNESKYKVAEALEKLGAQAVDFQFDLDGVQTWRVR